MNLITSPLLALITALSLLPLEGCVLSEVEVATPVIPEEPPAVVVEYEYGVPLPESDPVDDEWFEDTAFIGHSLIQGFSAYSGLNQPDYYYLAGSSVKTLLSSSQVSQPGGTGTLRSGLKKQSYDKIYLMMGINEVSNKMSTSRSDYLSLITLVRDYNPDADIYVLAVLPVSARKASGGVYTIENITAYNTMLMELCAEQNCWYVDLYSYFADENGCLPSSVASDGVHLNPKQYSIMLEYLRTHTVPASTEET